MMSRSSVIAVTSTLLVCLLPVSGTEAGPGLLRVETGLESWSFEPGAAGGESTIQEWATRFTVAYELTPAMTAELGAGLVDASLELRDPSGTTTETSLNGLLDTKLRFNYRASEQLLLRVGLNGPTGMTELSYDETSLVQALAARILAFDVDRTGEGFDVGLGASYAMPVGGTAVGFGVGYLAKGSYAFQSGGADYDPGNQVSLAGGIDYETVDWLWRTNARTVFYAADTRDAMDFFRTGNRFDLQSTGLRRWPRTTIRGSLLLIAYGRGQELVGGSLEDEDRKSLGNEYYLDFGGNRVLSDRLSVKLSFGARFFGASEKDQREATRYDVGFGVKRRLDRRFDLEVGGGYGVGELKQEIPELRNQAKADLSGFGLSVALTAGF